MPENESNQSLAIQKFQLAYEHEDFLVVIKPQGVSFHNDSGSTGFFNLAKLHFKTDLWPVHRLDKLTSGLIILAKTQTSAKTFGEMFENKKIYKTYLAISNKKPKKKQGKIIGDMKKSRNGSWKLIQSKTNPAQTQFQSVSLMPKIRLFLIKPMTGKTHQIRVALKSLGSPILGDSRYGGNESDRAYLHAYQLKFNWYGKMIKIKCAPTEGKLFQLAKMEVHLKNLSSDPNPFT